MPPARRGPVTVGKVFRLHNQPGSVLLDGSMAWDRHDFRDRRAHGGGFSDRSVTLRNDGAMSSTDSLITEIKDVLDGGSPSRREAILHELTKLFLDGAERYSNEQIAVFDDVLLTVVEHVDREALAELSGRLASCAKAPPTLLRKLASHLDLKISAVMLKEAVALSEDEIAAIAATASHNHLQIIASRVSIGERVTDALINRGDVDAMRKFVPNEQARISHVGFVKLINAAKRENSLTEIVASRTDLPDELKPFIAMLRRSSEPAPAGASAAAAAG